jgi:hypothetical protein
MAIFNVVMNKEDMDVCYLRIWMIPGSGMLVFISYELRSIKQRRSSKHKFHPILTPKMTTTL